METENPQTNQPQTENPQTETDKPDLAERVGIVEAILFVTGNAVEKSEICRAMGITHEELEETLNALEGGYDYDRRGLRLLRFGQHVQLATRPDYAKYVEKLLQPVQKQSLSQAVMETLAVIAYRQPVTEGGNRADSRREMRLLGADARLARTDRRSRPQRGARQADSVWHDGRVSAPLLPDLAGRSAGDRFFRAGGSNCRGRG